MRVPISRVALSFLLSGISIAGLAQIADPTRTADHEALRALKEKVVKSLNARDVGALSSCLSKSYVLTTIDRTALTSEPQLRDYFKKTFEAPTSFVTDLKLQAEADVLTQFLSDDVGFCYGTTTEIYTMRTGKVVTMKNRWTATVVRQDGEWKVAVAQGTANFLDNPLLAKVKSQIVTSGAGGLIGGLLLGLIGGILLCRRRSRPAV